MMSQQKDEKCPDCKEEVKEGDLALGCDLCLKWYHINCQSIGKTVYNFLMKKNNQIHWFCKQCDGHAITSMKLIQDVQTEMKSIKLEVEQLRSSNVDIMSRLEKIESKAGQNMDTPGAEKVTDIQKKLEALEKNQRTLNLVFTRLPEVEVGEETELAAEEKKLVDDVLNKLQLTKVEVDVLGRIGPKKDDRKRPLKVKVTKMTEKLEILRKASTLRQMDKYRDIYITPDLTREQQLTGKKLRDELKNRTSNGEANLWIQKGKVVVKKREEEEE